MRIGQCKEEEKYGREVVLYEYDWGNSFKLMNKIFIKFIVVCYVERSKEWNIK